MKNSLKKYSNFILSNKWWFIGAAIIIVLFLLGQLVTNGGKTKTETVVVKKIDLREIVSVTGRVRPAQNASLSFERGGNVDGVWVDVGDKVYRGQLLVSLVNDDVGAQLDQAKALLKKEQARMDELNAGAREEDMINQELSVTKAETSLNEAAGALVDTAKDAYSKTDDAIRNKIDQFFVSPRSAYPTLTFSTDFSSKTTLESARVTMEQEINDAFASFPLVTTTALAGEKNADIIKTYSNMLDTARSFTDQVSLVVNSLSANSSLSQSSIDIWKNNVSVARSNLSLAASSLSSAQDKFLVAISNLKIEQNRLAMLKAGVVKEQIAAQEAVVEQAQANVSSAQAQYA
jgi:multidrug efflux pump subunit AcrA (membrane-fusion protein)